MEFRVLRYFLTVARVESITKAAEALHITQPTLSRQLADLENQLGTKLLIRGKRKVSLTEAGLLLRQRAEEILALTDKTEKELSDQNNLVGGTVSIGSVESLTSEVLSHLLKGFYGKYPEVSYHIFSGTGDDIKEKIDKGLLDIGILLEPINIEKYEFIRLPQKERWGVLTKKSSLLAGKEFVTSEDLIGEPLILSSRPEIRSEFSSWSGMNYSRLNIVATFTLISNVVKLVENNFGSVICIEGALSLRHSDELCFIPFLPDLHSGSVIVWKKHKVFTQTVSRFIDFIKYAL